MTIDYDVKVPRKRGYGKYADAFWDFYESDHATVAFGLDSVDQAMSCQKAMCMLRDRNGIFDITITRRSQIVFLERGGAEC